MTSQAKCHRIGRTCQPTRNRKSSAYAGLLVAGVLALATSPTVGATNDLESTLPGLLAGPTCTPAPVETKLAEWDINAVTDIDPGAVVVDDRSSSRNSKVWFVTRNGETRIYRLTPGRGFKKDAAEAKSWPLGAIQTGGVRLRNSSDGRFAFVNVNRAAVGALVAVDTSDDTRVAWPDRPQQGHMSDVSVDTRGGAYNVFTAALEYQDDNGNIDGGDGVVQRLRPRQPKFVNNQWIVPAEVTRWPVGGGAGSCDDTGPGFPCIPGVVVDRRDGHRIFFSEPNFVNKFGAVVPAIGELDPRPVKCSSTDLYGSCVKVRHWPLPPFEGSPLASPRQILLDDNGKLWGVTSSGHLFSLEVERKYDKGTVTRHNPLGPGPEDLFAVAPDGGTIGFTDTGNQEVSVLFPKAERKPVYAEVRLVRSLPRTINGVREAALSKKETVTPRSTTGSGLMYTNEGDGTYVETNVSGAALGEELPLGGAANPRGMHPDGARKTGSFFYGVNGTNEEGMPTNRIGHFEVRIDPGKETEHRKDDDDYDDDGDDDDYDHDDDNDGKGDDVDDDDDNDCTPDAMDKDWDNDGVENEHDSKSNRENKRTDRGTMAPGGAKEYEMESDSNSLLVVAIVEAANLATPLSIELVDPNGIVVLTVPTVLGKAVATATPALPGLYTVRVRNSGLTSTTYKTTLISKSIWF